MPYRVTSAKPSNQPRTLGVSRKLVAALAPPLTTIVGTLITTGTLDRAQLAVAASIVIGGLLAYFSAPDAVTRPALPAAYSLATGLGAQPTAGAVAHWTVSGGPHDDPGPREMDREPADDGASDDHEKRDLHDGGLT